MGKKDIQQGDEESRGLCRQCLSVLQCCQLPAATGVKIVSIISILIGLVFCCLGVWTIIVTTNNNELAPRNQVVFEIPQSSPVNNNGQPAQSVHSAVANAGEQDTISTQSSLFDTSNVYISSSSSSSSSGAAPPPASPASSSSSSSSGGASSSTSTSSSSSHGGGSNSWPLSSVSTSKGPSGRKPPVMNHVGPKKLIPLSNYHTYLLILGIISVCVGFIRTVASIFLLWNSVEKHSKSPGVFWILLNVVGTVGLLVFLCVTLNVTGFINDFPWRPMPVQNDRFNFYLLLAMFRIVCICDIFLTFYFVLVVMWFLRTVN
ncbi:unnamed protein product [Orchesella dallaii]|uniref:Uncharacterized protein n=1 Tax=Orchesella dallaii TaxID=48710 RepID=A0ABP1R884_9HEXA